MSRFLVHPFTSKYLAFAFVPQGTVVASPHVVIAFDSYDAFAVLQCRVHEYWAHFFGSTLEDRHRYAASDCFETFPLPELSAARTASSGAGRDYYEFRARIMVTSNEGLTDTYNRFHNPNETDLSILKLRGLHDAMDRAVLEAYGWTDLKPACEFLLDYEEDDDESENNRRRKKPWRYRWPDEIRDEVLARLLELNAKRAKEETAAALACGSSGATKKRGKRERAAGPQGNLF